MIYICSKFKENMKIGMKLKYKNWLNNEVTGEYRGDLDSARILLLVNGKIQVVNRKQIFFSISR